MENRLSTLEKSVYKLAGERFLINSHQQLGRILFEKLNLPGPKRPGGESDYSTEAEVLEQLSLWHPLPGAALEYRSLSRLKSTYADALLEKIHPCTGRIHTTYNQAVTVTGRLSSTYPNLQSIPVRSKEAGRLRRVFIPEEGWWLLSADYSQVELRVLAHLSGDKILCGAFQSGEDIHSRTAAEVFEVGLAEVTPEQRRRAKAINFGIIYGQKAMGLARELGVSYQEAREFIKRYFKRYPGVKRFRTDIVRQAKDQGFVTTLMGRRRMIPNIHCYDRAEKEAAERVAVNTPIQGTAADIIKLAMIRIAGWIREKGWASRMLLQVHDELVFESPPEEIDLLEAVVRREMENVMELKVALEVKARSGRNRDEAH